MLHPLLLLLLLLFFILVIFVSFFFLFPFSPVLPYGVFVTAHVKDYDTPGSPSITRDTRVWNWMPQRLVRFPSLLYPPVFLFFLIPPLQPALLLPSALLSNTMDFFFLNKNLFLSDLFFYQFFTPCRLSRWSLDWDPPMNSGRILIDVNQKS